MLLYADVLPELVLVYCETADPGHLGGYYYYQEDWWLSGAVQVLQESRNESCRRQEKTERGQMDTKHHTASLNIS